MDKIRGFSTNVANYDPIGSTDRLCPPEAFRRGGNVAHYCHYENPGHACCQYDPCQRINEYNSAPTELIYVQVPLMCIKKLKCIRVLC